MTEDLTITEYEHDATRVFALKEDSGGRRRFVDEEGEVNAAEVAKALGVDEIDPKYVDVIRVQDLGDVGLAGYLGEGHGVEDSLLQANADRLGSARGVVLVVGSAAFRARPTRLSPDDTLEHLATYRVEARDGTLQTMPHGQTSGPDVQREASEMKGEQSVEPVGRSTIQWVVIGALVVAAILVVMVAF